MKNMLNKMNLPVGSLAKKIAGIKARTLVFNIVTLNNFTLGSLESLKNYFNLLPGRKIFGNGFSLKPCFK
jgi:hypothetical protein